MPDSRKNLRYYFEDQPLHGTFFIYRMDNTIVNSAAADVSICDLSGGGMRFFSRLNLPVTDRVLLTFSFRSLHKNFILHGHIKRKEKQSDGCMYGVFFPDEVNDQKNDLVRTVHQLNLEQKARKH
ncbi:PilZ domain-containing protein [Marinococcus halotolerans]|uniref:PilZ domain-containing protein n=1 Tax=Marinococcus halotolerans TaxID=301092 RepID=UPI0003B603FF|nr:PilZ domain-containing protein [Marinococcus halotolerans]